MVSTSTHKSWQSDKFRTHDITGLWLQGVEQRPSEERFPVLEPKYTFWRIWQQNDGNLSKEENDKRYVEHYYQEVLSKLDPEEVYRELDLFGTVLLCDDEITRHIVAEWFEMLLGVEVPEHMAVEYIVSDGEKRPEYIRKYLDAAMRKDRNMRGFQSLQALYLFEQGEKLEQQAREFDVEHEEYSAYMQRACYKRCDADEAEAKYLEQMKNTQKTKMAQPATVE